jgi:hypothetical protein
MARVEPLELDAVGASGTADDVLLDWRRLAAKAVQRSLKRSSEVGGELGGRVVDLRGHRHLLDARLSWWSAAGCDFGDGLVERRRARPRCTPWPTSCLRPMPDWTSWATSRIPNSSTRRSSECTLGRSLHAGLARPGVINFSARAHAERQTYDPLVTSEIAFRLNRNVVGGLESCHARVHGDYTAGGFAVNGFACHQ